MKISMDTTPSLNDTQVTGWSPSHPFPPRYEAQCLGTSEEETGALWISLLTGHHHTANSPGSQILLVHLGTFFLPNNCGLSWYKLTLFGVFFNPTLLAWAQSKNIARDLHKENSIMISISTTGFPKSIMAPVHVKKLLTLYNDIIW